MYRPEEVYSPQTIELIQGIMEMHGQTREEVIEGLKKCPNLVFREDILAKRNKK